MGTRGLRAIALALVVALGSAGCSLLPGRSGPEYREAMQAMYPDAMAAVKATMPTVKPTQSSGALGSDHDCGGGMFSDANDASKRYSALGIDATSAPSETRTPRVLADSAVGFLTDRGWRVEKWPGGELTPPDPETGNGAGVELHLKKPGSGSAVVSASSSRITSGEVVQILNVQVTTDCLRNADWRKH
ncbi:hypothetical protein [Streptomyces violascens]|uniref:hypothetical protein n=1 Tax=Streptomyces violascens TaxID=67381 RepID=UPI00367C5E8C